MARDTEQRPPRCIEMNRLVVNELSEFRFSSQQPSTFLAAA